MKVYYVYIITNYSKKSIYVGVTNDLARRLDEHVLNKGNKHSWSGRYNCCYLIHFERFNSINEAIAREKEIKGFRRSKKEDIINENNPEWNFLNDF